MIETKNEYKKRFAIKIASKHYGFKKTEFHDRMSFVLNCSFWQTKYENIYITDYDFINSDDLEKKGQSMLFYRKKGVMKYQIIINDILNNETLFNYALDRFKNDCNN